MADSREMTFGLDFGLKDAIDQLEDIVTRLEQAVDSARDAEEAGRSMGAGIQAGADTGAAGLRNMRDEAEDAGDSLDDIGTNFRAIGREADSFGSAVAKSMGTAAKESNSVSKTMRAGFDGAIGYTEKKFNTFTGKVQKGVKGIGTAFTHPIATIKGKFLGAVEEAANKLNGLGDDADDARRDLDDMGDEGEKAGGEVKEAIKGALAAFVGFEAIQAGIDMLKELGAAAIEAAGAAENSGKKFEASFAGTDAAAWVDNYAASVHRSTAEVQSFMVSNKAMYGEMGITGDAAAELSKVTTSLAYDFGNAFSMADADALGVVQDYLSGNSAALARVASYYLPAAVVREQIGGVGFYRFLKRTLATFDNEKETLATKLAEVARRVFTDDNCTIGFTGKDDDFNRVMGAGMATGRTGEPGCTARLVVPEPQVPATGEAFAVPTDVTYTALGFDRRLLGVPYSGAWLVASRALSYDFLWNEVRVKGGAYGAGFSPTRTGNLRFYSYRDPHVDETLERFRAAGAWLSDFSPSEAEMDGYIVSTVAGLDAPLKPRERRQDGYVFAHIDPAERLVTRSQVANATIEEVRALGDAVSQAASKNIACVFGNREIIGSAKADFTVVDLLGE